MGNRYMFKKNSTPKPLQYCIIWFVIIFWMNYAFYAEEYSVETRTTIHQVNTTFDMRSIYNKNLLNKTKEFQGKNIPVVIVLCQKEAKTGENSEITVNSLENSQFYRQVKVLLKSIAIATERQTRIIIVANTKIPIEGVKKYIQQWPVEFQTRINIVYQTFKPTKECMDEKLFKLCTSVRLFLHEILPQEDAVIYVDSDFIFLESPEKLSQLFNDFNDEQIIGATHNGGYYEILEQFKFADYYYYGNSGLAASILLMNLTRIRNFQYGWTNTVFGVCKSYKRRLSLFDQGVYNIIFSEFEENLYDLDCRWNFNAYYCHKYICNEAIKYGNIFALHGPSNTFFQHKSKKLKVVFQAFEKFELGESISDLVSNLKSGLLEIEKLQPEDTDGCKEFPGLDEALLHHLLLKNIAN